MAFCSTADFTSHLVKQLEDCSSQDEISCNTNGMTKVDWNGEIEEWNEREMEHLQEHREEEEEAEEVEKSEDECVSNGEKLKRMEILLEKASLFSEFIRSNLDSWMASRMGDSLGNEDKQDTKAAKRKRSCGSRPRKSRKSSQSLENEHKQSPTEALRQPVLVTGGKLWDYQLYGMAWLIALWENGLNGILGDEMGLGKTVQCISMLSHLKENGIHGPYLIVAPLSTLPNWVAEINRWTPSIRAIMYHGLRESRRKLLEDINVVDGRADESFPIIVTSYELAIRDRRYLSRFIWKYLIVDEGHRLKNFDCRLIRELKKLQSENRLLLTGTPLQNKLSELWSLLNFVLPDVFEDLSLFEKWFNFSDIGNRDGDRRIIAEEESNSIVSKLHHILRPFLLRRTKADVDIYLPRKTEFLVFASMTAIQKQFYDAIISKRFDELQSTGHKLLNTLMQLRKCCNHPYLFMQITEENPHPYDINEELVNACGKLQILDWMLPELQSQGSRVLIFSQMTRVLDILEDYLSLRGQKWCRLDGTTPCEERLEQIEEFQSNPSILCFLLSTRAGGLGINLTEADTVILFDSDWNPQQDLQAQDRCHRIGQTKPVHIYRLVTVNSIEMQIMKKANAKRKLHRLVMHGVTKNLDDIQSRVQDRIDSNELIRLLRDDFLHKSSSETGSLLQCAINENVVYEILNRSRLWESGDCGEGYEVVATCIK